LITANKKLIKLDIAGSNPAFPTTNMRGSGEAGKHTSYSKNINLLNF